MAILVFGILALVACSGGPTGESKKRELPGGTTAVPVRPAPPQQVIGGADGSLSVQLHPLVDVQGTGLMASGEAAVVAFSADGKQLFAGGGLRESALQAWDAQRGVRLGAFTGGTRKVSTLALSPDGATLASCDVSRTVSLFSVAGRSLLVRLTGHDQTIYSLAWMPDSAALIALDSDGRLVRWQVSAPDAPQVISASTAPTAGLAIAPDGSSIATGAKGGGLALYSTAGAQSRSVGAGPVSTVAFSRDSQVVYLASQTDHSIVGIDAISGRTVATFKGHSGTVNALTTTPDGRRLLSAAGDGVTRVWDAATGRALATMTAEGVAAFWSVAVSADGAQVASAGNGRTIGLWRLDTFAPVQADPESGHRDSVISLAWSPDGEWLASGDAAGRIFIRRASDGSIARRLGTYRARIEALAYAPSGATLLSAADGEARAWNVQTGASGRAFPVGRGAAVVYSLDGRYLATSDSSRVVELRDGKTGAVVRRFGSDSGLRQNLMRPTSVSFSPDGKFLATARWDEPVKVYEVATGGKPRELDGFLNVRWSPDGATLATSHGRVNKRAREVRLRLWSASTWKRERDLDIDSAVEFAGGGRLLLGIDEGARSVGIWSRADGKLRAQARMPGQFVTSLAVTRDGGRLAVGDDHGGLRIWDLTALPGN